MDAREKLYYDVEIALGLLQVALSNQSWEHVETAYDFLRLAAKEAHLGR